MKSGCVLSGVVSVGEAGREQTSPAQLFPYNRFPGLRSRAGSGPGACAKASSLDDSYGPLQLCTPWVVSLHPQPSPSTQPLTLLCPFAPCRPGPALRDPPRPRPQQEGPLWAGGRRRRPSLAIRPRPALSSLLPAAASPSWPGGRAPRQLLTAPPPFLQPFAFPPRHES